MMKINPWVRCPNCQKIHIVPPFVYQFTCNCGWGYMWLTNEWIPLTTPKQPEVDTSKMYSQENIESIVEIQGHKEIHTIVTFIDDRGIAYCYCSCGLMNGF